MALSFYFSARFYLSTLVALCLSVTFSNLTKAAEVISQMNDDAARIKVQGFIISTELGQDSDSALLKNVTDLAQKERGKYPQVLSIDELHQIADTLTLAVRKEGHNFDSIYLPPQKVANGLILLNYQKATLTKINIINRSDHTDEVLAAPFKKHLNQHLFGPDLEETVYALRARENLDVFAFYSRGTNPGEVTINARISPRATDWYSVMLDNYGASATGENRLVANFRFRSLLSAYDRLSAALLHTDGDGNVNYGYVNYQYWFPSLDTAFEFSVGNNHYGLGSSFETLNTKGDSISLRMALTHVLNHSPNENKYFSLEAFSKRSNFGSDDVLINSVLEEKESSDGFSAIWNGNSSVLDWRVNTGLALTAGKFDTITRSGEPLRKINYQLFTSRMFNASSKLAVLPSVYVRGQLNDKTHLPGLESLSLSGIGAVRGYELGRFNADDGTLITANLAFPNVFNKQLLGKPFFFEPFFFYDKANGTNYSTLSDSSLQTSISAAGIGLSARWGRWSSQLTYAKPGESELTDKAQVYVQIRWQ